MDAKKTDPQMENYKKIQIASYRATENSNDINKVKAALRSATFSLENEYRDALSRK